MGTRKKKGSKLGRYLSIQDKIMKALNDERFYARTIAGIAEQTGLEPQQIVITIKKDPQLKDTVKVFPRKTSRGEILITTEERFSESASLKDKFIDLFSTKRASLHDDE